MFTDLAEALVWIIRVALLWGLAWGAWLCIGHLFFPSRSEMALQIEHFATFAVLILVLTTLGGALHAGA
jgi:hypothetical protein